LNKTTVQVTIAILICVIWVAGVITAAFDGKDLLKISTGPFGIVLGWAFTSKATEGS
jgi:hypothetical protein